MTVPFVPFAGPTAGLGLGQADTPPAPGSWREFAFRLSQPFAQALSQRIAYGTPPPYAYPGGSSFFYQPGGGAPYIGTGFGGFDPSTLLLVGGGLALLLMLSRR